MLKTNLFSSNPPVISGFVPEVHSYGFNGMEKQNEHTSGNYDFGARILDTRLGRWMSVDILFKNYNDLSPYNFAGDSPIILFDNNGEKIINGHAERLAALNIVREERANMLKAATDGGVKKDIRLAKRELRKVENSINFEQKHYDRIQNAVTDIEKYWPALFTRVDNMTDQEGQPADIVIYSSDNGEGAKIGGSIRGNYKVFGRTKAFKLNGQELIQSKEFAGQSTTITGGDATINLSNEMGNFIFALERTKQQVDISLYKQKNNITPMTDYGKYATSSDENFSFWIDDKMGQAISGTLPFDKNSQGPITNEINSGRYDGIFIDKDIKQQ